MAGLGRLFARNVRTECSCPSPLLSYQSLLGSRMPEGRNQQGRANRCSPINSHRPRQQEAEIPGGIGPVYRFIGDFSCANINRPPIEKKCIFAKEIHREEKEECHA
jgi:hypothetical protein